jgi:hypothetical protein
MRADTADGGGTDGVRTGVGDASGLRAGAGTGDGTSIEGVVVETPVCSGP